MLLLAAFLLPTISSATVILDQGALTQDITEVRTNRPLDEYPRSYADGFTFSGTAGDAITLTVNRLTASFDAYLVLHFGDITGTTVSDIWTGSVAIADDDIQEFTGYDGWFSDPQLLAYTLSSTGTYTAIVSCAACDQAGDRLDSVSYQITLGTPPTGPVGVPEPTTIALMGLGLAGIGWKRRKAT